MASSIRQRAAESQCRGSRFLRVRGLTGRSRAIPCVSVGIQPKVLKGLGSGSKATVLTEVSPVFDL